ncbi:non-ribosomal peptide synthetase [Phytohabitans houttuyneae]|uniref:Carrier domain-containing protein n=1 Tax=Phytohabitans houttuyneae TaxID=1076126 RepID=A0A6V8K6W4_9ACTN|nr:non-ribosomal peptide synthetase [Phytohabitans houttuyneae]GFJ78048.1 hypothetical protein Phou_022280 [Phytohabitans houttuyneae]
MPVDEQSGLTAASDVQHGIWFTERSGAAGAAYHLAMAVRFGGEIDVAALRRACDAVVARHSALGSVLTERDGRLCLVPAARPPRLEIADLAGDDLTAAVARPFDLARGPLARLMLLCRPSAPPVLLVVAHHAVFDGTSKEILLRDLADAYGAERGAVATTAVPAPLPPARPDDGAREYWRSRWREPRDPVLPGLRRAVDAAEPGTSTDIVLDEDLPRRMAETCRLIGVTRFELLLTAVLALLHRYGDPEPVVAIDVSTRGEGNAGAVGPFVNELPVFSPPPVGTCRDFARAVRAELRELYRFRRTAVARTVPGLRPRPALAPVSLSYRRREPGTPCFGDVPTTVDWTVFSGTARNALHIQVVDDGSTLAMSLQHPSEAFEPGTAAAIGGHLRTVLATMVADPDAPVAGLPILQGAELHKLLHAWNATERPYPPHSTVVGLFEAQAAATPDAPAVMCDGQPMSYRELAAAVRRLAGQLRARGVAGGVVAVRMPRSADLVVSILAIARAGAAFLPLDPRHPEARQQRILAEARPVLVLTGADLDSRVNGAAPGGDPEPGPADLAYVIYTSGSTGEPKGVAVSHGALANLLQAMRDAVGWGPADPWLAHTALSFDIAALELLAPLVAGATTVVATDGEAADGRALVGLIRRHGITRVQATPSGWRMLVDAGIGDGPERHTTVALAGGETLPGALAREVGGRVARLFNVYGPTETTIWSTVAELPADVGDGEVTIGRPIANTRVYVLDAAAQPVPVGLPGELYIGGRGVAEGYRGRPDLTVERFRADPHGPAGARVYRTGDRVRYLADGRLVFLGRVDNQVKIRGHRVELGEIEARLLEHPAVAEAAVVLTGAGRGDPQLVAYLRYRRGMPALDAATLRQHAGQTLPAVMVPAVWVTLDTFPVTFNGKLDRSALPAPPRPQAPAAGSTVPGPADGVLAQVQAMWSEALDGADIGLDQDLFELGAHSLTVIMVSNRIEQAFAVSVSPAVFYETPTVSAIAEEVVRLRA